MRYLITGGNSFIGKALTHILLLDGHEIILVCRGSSHLDNLNSKQIRIVRYKDMSDVESIKSDVPTADVFVHLAWNGTRGASRNDREAQQRNVEDSMLALQTAKDLGCKLFVEAGSQAEYGLVKETITEETPCHPENEYGKAKLKFGELAEEYCARNGMKFIHLRIVSIFGETDHPGTLVMSCIRKMLNNEDVELSSCQQLWNFVDIEDAVNQIYLLCQHAINSENFTSEIYLIASRDTRKLRSFVEEMRILTHTKSVLHFGEYTPANVVTLDPCVDKTEHATGGFIASKTFGEVVNKIIANYKNNMSVQIYMGGVTRSNHHPCSSYELRPYSVAA